MHAIIGKDAADHAEAASFTCGCGQSLFLPSYSVIASTKPLSIPASCPSTLGSRRCCSEIYAHMKIIMLSVFLMYISKWN